MNGVDYGGSGSVAVSIITDFKENQVGTRRRTLIHAAGLGAPAQRAAGNVRAVPGYLIGDGIIQRRVVPVIFAGDRRGDIVMRNV